MGLAAGFATKAAIKVLALADVRERRIDVDGVCSSNRDARCVQTEKNRGLEKNSAGGGSSVCNRHVFNWGYFREHSRSSGCNRHVLNGLLQGALKVIGV